MTVVRCYGGGSSNPKHHICFRALRVLAMFAPLGIHQKKICHEIIPTKCVIIYKVTYQKLLKLVKTVGYKHFEVEDAKQGWGARASRSRVFRAGRSQVFLAPWRLSRLKKNRSRSH